MNEITQAMDSVIVSEQRLDVLKNEKRNEEQIEFYKQNLLNCNEYIDSIISSLDSCIFEIDNKQFSLMSTSLDKHDVKWWHIFFEDKHADIIPFEIERDLSEKYRNLEEKYNKVNIEKDIFCTQCGTKLSSKNKFCGNCGLPVS